MNGVETIAAWDLSEAHRLIDHPAVRLLRSPNAAFTLTFLHRAFKEHQAISVPESHLRARLENFLDEARLHRPGAYPQGASEYLATWCGTEQVLLRKLYSSESDEPVFELTTAAERALQWLDDLQARPFIAAESRLELIFRQLEEIVLFSTSDVDQRIAASNDLTLVEHGPFIEAVLRLLAKTLTPQEFMHWITTPGVSELERLSGQATYAQ